MNSAKPPRLAAWILKHFGPERNHEALAGDLNEAFQQGRSKRWYWRQVLAALRWGALFYVLLCSALVGWLVTSPALGHTSFFLSWPVDMAIAMIVYCASFFVPRLMRGRLRALVVLLIVVCFGLLWRYRPDLGHYWIFFWFVAANFASLWKGFAPPPYHLTRRELLLGDPVAEKKRMIAKLEQSMMEETDPEVRHAYAESIAALKANASPAVKAVE